MGSGPADVVPVRIDPELRAAIETGAEAEDSTTSEISSRRSARSSTSSSPTAASLVLVRAATHSPRLINESPLDLQEQQRLVDAGLASCEGEVV